MKTVFCLAVMSVCCMLLTGCGWGGASTVRFEPRTAIDAPIDYKAALVLSPKYDANWYRSARDSGRGTFVVLGDGIYVIPEAYQSQFKDLPSGQVLNVPEQLVRSWIPVHEAYGPEAAQQLRQLNGTPFAANGTKELPITAGPLATDKTVAYVGRQCFVQASQPAPAIPLPSKPVITQKPESSQPVRQVLDRTITAVMANDENVDRWNSKPDRPATGPSGGKGL